MSTINERIAAVVKASGMTKTAFAEKINVSQPHVSRMVSGESIPSDRTISDICRVFGVSETWLRTGEGEMRLNLDRTEELKAIFGDIMASDDAKARLVKAFAMLPDEAYPKLEEYIKKIAQELSKE
nr:MAG TPA: helix-turn-helix domain protein [Caudoviricetes sp.]